MATATTTTTAPAVAVPVGADPAPLGLAGFAMTTFVLSLWNTNIYPPAIAATLGLAIFYGGIAQLLAGMWEFRRNNTFGALAFSSYGAFWLAFWYYAKDILPTLSASDASVATGTFLLGWTIFTAYMTIAAMRVSGAVLAVFVLLTITYVFLTIGAFHADIPPKVSTITKIGGWVGIATAAAAWYASFAGVVNSTFRRAIIPTYPLDVPAPAVSATTVE